MRKCDNCIGEAAIKKFVRGGCVNMRILIRAVNKIGKDVAGREAALNSLLSISEIIQVRRLEDPDFEDVAQILNECGIHAVCSCTKGL